MAAAPRGSSCYFLISPNPIECPQGLLAPDKLGVLRPMFYIKFGDGTWSSENPSLMPSSNSACADGVGPDAIKYYLTGKMRDGQPVAVQAGKALETLVLGVFEKATSVNSENADELSDKSDGWYKIRALPGQGLKLGLSLVAVSKYVESQEDFGYRVALLAWQAQPNNVAIHKLEATTVMGLHVAAILELLKDYLAG